ncbi:uroporphyrinogen-III synthase [Cellulomonas carbonis]|uniref:uroporphyrinogen-III synthase n=1 Tax=Cellulomonas carbonis TaxID=1386092 RepID=UPI00137754AF|nr:uroporphyrinogen-III synthase [Cellulomonas carbonis]
MSGRTGTTGPQGTDGALAGRRVLVPHGGDWGRRVAALLAEHGAEAVVVPLIEFSPPDDVRPLDDAMRRLAGGAYDWLVVTSGTTVTALAGRVRAPAGLVDVLGGAHVAAVGPGTARVLERHRVTPDLVPAGERSARGLVAEFPAPAGPASRVLVPHSDLAEPTVVDGLRAAGWRVDDVVAYRTVAGPQPGAELRAAVRDGDVDTVLLSSASTVTNLVELVGVPPASTVVCCIGPRTEAAARAHGLEVHVVPAAASAEDMVGALVRHAADHPRRPA